MSRSWRFPSSEMACALMFRRDRAWIATVALASVVVGLFVFPPASALAKPELLSARFVQAPQAGTETTLELRFRDPHGTVDDVHVFWGDGGVDYAVIATPGIVAFPNPLTPRGAEQVLFLRHTFRTAGAFLLRLELYDHYFAGGRTDAQLVVDVGPCAAPTLRASVHRKSRSVVAHVRARDPDAYIEKVIFRWGDGASSSRATKLVPFSDPGQRTELHARHQYSRRFTRDNSSVTVRIIAVSVGNPDSCPARTTAIVTRRITLKQPWRSRGIN